MDYFTNSLVANGVLQASVSFRANLTSHSGPLSHGNTVAKIEKEITFAFKHS